MSAAHPVEPRYLTLSEAAERLRTSPQTVGRMLRTGRMVGARLNREWRMTPEQVDAALQPVARVEREVVRVMPYARPIRLTPAAQRAVDEGRAPR